MRGANVSLFLVFVSHAISSIAYADFSIDSDLISLHYDHAPDRDDAHAAVAGLMVASSIGFRPHVVSGAYGDANKSRYNPRSENVMDAVWPSYWLNAHSHYADTLQLTVSAWIATLRNGGSIFVAEGGQSDFTADVVRQIQAFEAIETRTRITVVQHSQWNEDHTSETDLRYVKENTNYIRLDNGNHTNNSANLNQKSSSFVKKARDGNFANQWAIAFDYLDPNEKLDFSDTVELLYILGIGKDRVASVDDFGNEFFRSSVSPIDPTTSDEESTDNVEISINVCSSALFDVDGDGYGWENDTSCVVSTSSDDNNIQPTITITDPIDDLQFPVCTSVLLDTDGDGYGWENDQSCLVATNDTSTTESPTNAPTLQDLFPQCSPAITDDNGDGFGWENDQSCLVVTNDTPTTESPTNAPTLEDLFPQCSPAITDDNGDGFGWENDTSCIISTYNNANSSQPALTNALDDFQFPICSSASFDTDGDGYGWENDNSCIVSIKQ